MQFKEMIRAAGFKTDAEFAAYIGRSKVIVSSWGDDPPLYAIRALEPLIKIREFAQCVLSR
jgi:hypothetical protein